MPETATRFAIGQIVRHKLFGYRGVIFDVDPHYMGGEAWYAQVARTRPPKDRPWYHVLVHDAIDTTYVAERNLVEDHERAPIEHPLVGRYFKRFRKDHYEPSTSEN